MTTKVRITNIVEEGNAHSNGDVIISAMGVVDVVLNPGESHEQWLQGPQLAITERWPSQKKSSG